MWLLCNQHLDFDDVLVLENVFLFNHEKDIHIWRFFLIHV